MNFPNINILWANLIIEELIRCGADYFCLSPGSRSSPLVVAMATNPKAKTLIHYDERGIAFHALGYISATSKPSVVISTSGTATANFFPAIIEASKKKLPLIVLTADRPPELHKAGADQTIDQVGIYGDYVRWHFDFPCPTQEIKLEFILTTIDQAVYMATRSLSGPIHINCMFREPLAPTLTKNDFRQYLREVIPWQKSQRPYTTYIGSDPSLANEKKREIIKKILQIKNGLIVVGKLKKFSEQKAVLHLAEKLNWPVFPDITSGLRSGHSNKNIISHFDQILLSEKFVRTYKCDGVIHIGGRITSKRWYQYVEQIRPLEYIMILNHPLRNDPLHIVSLRIETDIALFCNFLTKSIEQRRNTKIISLLKESSHRVDHIIDESTYNAKSLSEPTVARLVSKHIPPETGLFLANSMPIRDMDMFASDTNKFILGANRGASGIDGTIATATGFAKGINKIVTLLIGDLAFLHDLNSLALLRDLNHPLIVVVLNNNGGGIFSFLPIAQFDQIFEKYFGTPHDLHFQSASEMFNLHYANPKTRDEFTADYKNALSQKKSTIIEITTDRRENYQIHQKIQKKIQRHLDSLFTATVK